MAVVMPNEGLPIVMAYFLNGSRSGDPPWNLILWTNSSYTPSQSSVYSDLTIATFTGYTTISMTLASWTTPTISSNKAVSTWGATPQLWTATGAFQSIYGMAIVTSSSPKIIAIDKFSAPIDLSATNIIGVLPRLTLGTDPSPSMARVPSGTRKRFGYSPSPEV